MTAGAVPCVARRGCDPWQVEVSDVQLIADRRRQARGRFGATRSGTVRPG
jgi:hypothetical protein